MSAFIYLCANCGTQAKKEPLKATKEADGSLGTWRCPKGCKNTKVQRKRG